MHFYYANSQSNATHNQSNISKFEIFHYIILSAYKTMKKKESLAVTFTYRFLTLSSFHPQPASWLACTTGMDSFSSSFKEITDASLEYIRTI